MNKLVKVGNKLAGFEIKSTSRWKPEYNFGLKTLFQQKIIHHAFGIYLGEDQLRQDEIEILPFYDFPKAFRKVFCNKAMPDKKGNC